MVDDPHGILSGTYSTSNSAALAGRHIPKRSVYALVPKMPSLPPARTRIVSRASLPVVNLRNLHGVHVWWWTPNLEDHMEYHHETRTLRISSHKICLQSHLKVEKQETEQQEEMTLQDSGQEETNKHFSEWTSGRD